MYTHTSKVSSVSTKRFERLDVEVVVIAMDDRRVGVDVIGVVIGEE